MLNKVWDPKTARILSTTCIFALGLAFLYRARETLTLFLFAILFAYFLDPLVSRLEKPLRGRIQAIGCGLPHFDRSPGRPRVSGWAQDRQ